MNACKTNRKSQLDLQVESSFLLVAWTGVVTGMTAARILNELLDDDEMPVKGFAHDPYIGKWFVTKGAFKAATEEQVVYVTPLKRTSTEARYEYLCAVCYDNGAVVTRIIFRFLGAEWLDTLPLADEPSLSRRQKMVLANGHH